MPTSPLVAPSSTGSCLLGTPLITNFCTRLFDGVLSLHRRCGPLFLTTRFRSRPNPFTRPRRVSSPTRDPSPLRVRRGHPCRSHFPRAPGLELFLVRPRLLELCRSGDADVTSSCRREEYSFTVRRVGPSRTDPDR